MEVTRIRDGLWRWSVRRDGDELASAYLEHDDVMLLVDPVLPPPGEHLDRFRRAIDRDLERLGGAAWVLLTLTGDPRDADALAAMTGARAWVAGDAPPAGMRALPTGLPGEVALWSSVHRALMPGRALRVHGGNIVPAPDADAAALLDLAPEVVVPSVGPMAG
jgi:hypothetical protein